MHVSLVHPAGLPLERLATALTQLCEREGLDPCQTACVIIESLAWTPRLPREPKWPPRAAGLDSFRASVLDEEAVRRRAYEIWQAEGQPDGRALEHWCRAEVEFAQNQPVLNVSGVQCPAVGAQ